MIAPSAITVHFEWETQSKIIAPSAYCGLPGCYIRFKNLIIQVF